MLVSVETADVLRDDVAACHVVRCAVCDEFKTCTIAGRASSKMAFGERGHAGFENAWSWRFLTFGDNPNRAVGLLRSLGRSTHHMLEPQRHSDRTFVTRS